MFSSNGVGGEMYPSFFTGVRGATNRNIFSLASNFDYLRISDKLGAPSNLNEGVTSIDDLSNFLLDLNQNDYSSYDLLGASNKYNNDTINSSSFVLKMNSKVNVNSFYGFLKENVGDLKLKNFFFTQGQPQIANNFENGSLRWFDFTKAFTTPDFFRRMTSFITSNIDKTKFEEFLKANGFSEDSTGDVINLMSYSDSPFDIDQPFSSRYTSSVPNTGTNYFPNLKYR